MVVDAKLFLRPFISYSVSYKSDQQCQYGFMKTCARVLRERSGLVSAPDFWKCKLTTMQGFDEFMNLVIDDAVEVQLATRDGPEKRRQLGKA